MTRFGRGVVIVATVALLAFGACDRDDDDDSTPSVDSTATSGVGSDETTTTSDDNPNTTGGSSPTTSGSTATTSSSGAGESDDAEANGVIEVNIAGGVVEGGVQRRTVKQGAQVTLRFTSDAADEIHVHTYDLRQDLTPGQSADITFLAKIPGVIEVELENRKRKVLELEVKP